MNRINLNEKSKKYRNPIFQYEVNYSTIDVVSTIPFSIGSVRREFYETPLTPSP